MIKLNKVIQTSDFCPSEWDAWDDTSQYYYLRYRHGEGTMEAQPSPDLNTWTLQTVDEMAGWFTTEEDEVDISLEDFLAHLPNVTLADDVVVRSM